MFRLKSDQALAEKKRYLDLSFFKFRYRLQPSQTITSGSATLFEPCPRVRATSYKFHQESVVAQGVDRISDPFLYPDIRPDIEYPAGYLFQFQALPPGYPAI